MRSPNSPSIVLVNAAKQDDPRRDRLLDTPPRSPRVSIVIPTFNVAPYLALTMKSVLGQTFSDFEVILYDDGSTDETLRVAKEIAAHDRRVKVLRGDNGGAASARNRGLAATDSRTEFITFFDSDDVWEEQGLEILVRALEARPEAPGAHGLCRCIDSDGNPYSGDVLADDMRRRIAIVGNGLSTLPTTAPTTFGALLMRNYITTPGVSLVRRSALAMVGPFEQSVAPCEDWDMNLRLARLGDFVFVDQVLLSWRRHAGAISMVSKSWRHAYCETRRRSVSARENTRAQRRAARLALLLRMVEIQKEALNLLLSGSARPAAKRIGLSLLLASIWLGIPSLR
jgi:glycosyltransferase involved in cell wall biosynthesis